MRKSRRLRFRFLNDVTQDCIAQIFHYIVEFNLLETVNYLLVKATIKTRNHLSLQGLFRGKRFPIFSHISSLFLKFFSIIPKIVLGKIWEYWKTVRKFGKNCKRKLFPHNSLCSSLFCYIRKRMWKQNSFSTPTLDTTSNKRNSRIKR